MADTKSIPCPYRCPYTDSFTMTVNDCHQNVSVNCFIQGGLRFFLNYTQSVFFLSPCQTNRLTAMGITYSVWVEHMVLVSTLPPSNERLLVVASLYYWKGISGLCQTHFQSYHPLSYFPPEVRIGFGELSSTNMYTIISL